MLFVGDDGGRAAGHHDVEVQDETGRRLAEARLPEGIEGLSRLHALLAEHMPEEWVDDEPYTAGRRVCVGIGTGDGPWVQALLAAAYQVYEIPSMSMAGYRDRHSTPGSKLDGGDAPVLAEIVRLERGQHRQLAGDGQEVEGLQIVARTHQEFIWERQRSVRQLRATLHESFPGMEAALDAAGIELADPDALELLGRAPDPDRARALSRSKIAAALKRAGRPDVEAKAEQAQTALRAPALRESPEVQRTHALIVSSQVQLLTKLVASIAELQRIVGEAFWPVAEG